MIGTSAQDDRVYLPDAVWSLTDAFLVFFVGLVGSVIGVSIVQGTGGSDFTLVTVGLFAQAIAALGLAAYFSASRGTGEWDRDYGLSIDPKQTWWLALGFVLQVAVAVVISPLVELFAPEDPPQQSIADVAEGLEGGSSTLVFLFLVVVVAPLVEEVIFRGMLLSRLRRSMGPWASIALSAAVFAGIHLIDPNALYAVPGLFLIGLALGWAALKYGDLSVPIFLHAGVNLTGALFLLFGEELLEMAETTALLLLR